MKLDNLSDYLPEKVDVTPYKPGRKVRNRITGHIGTLHKSESGYGFEVHVEENGQILKTPEGQRRSVIAKFWELIDEERNGMMAEQFKRLYGGNGNAE